MAQHDRNRQAPGAIASPASRSAIRSVRSPRRRGHTKLDVVRYHERIGAWLLPQLAPRPIAVVKCMGGRFDDCFFQKHLSRAPTRRTRRRSCASPTSPTSSAPCRTAASSSTRGARAFRASTGPTASRSISIPIPVAVGSAAGGGRATCGRCSTARAAAGSSRRPAARDCISSCRSRAAIRGPRRRRSRARIADRLAQDVPALFTATVGQGRAVGSRLRRLPAQCRRRDGGRRVFAAGARRVCRCRCRSRGTSSPATTCAARHFNIDNAEAGAWRARRVDPWADYDASRQTISATMRRAVGA